MSKEQLSKGQLSKETLVQGDISPRRLLSKETLVQVRLWSKETIICILVQGRNIAKIKLNCWVWALWAKTQQAQTWRTDLGDTPSGIIQAGSSDGASIGAFQPLLPQPPNLT